MLDFFKKIFFIYLIIILCSLSVFVLGYYFFEKYKDYENEKTASYPFVYDGYCNVAVVPISGLIGVAATDAQVEPSGTTISSIPYTGDVDRVIRDLEYVKNSGVIKGVVLQIDSYGGVGNAAQILLSYLEDYPLPVVSLIRDAGDSMGYWVALGGRKIIAYPGAEVGSIGVNSSFASNAEKNKNEGVEYISIVSGKYKDAGSSDKEVTSEELEYLKKHNNAFFEVFVTSVASSRGLEPESVRDLADGRVWLGEEAVQLGLVDEVGDIKVALSRLSEYFLEQEEPVACAMY